MFDQVMPGFRIPRTIFGGCEVGEGEGFRLRRLIGVPELDMVDPFLLLDVFSTDEDANGGNSGFPAHPHRGIETVTYLIDGLVRHKDSTGHERVVRAGGVQWMTAGRGVIHSEMPEQTQGRVAGFQLWVNLPKANKMDPARYQDFAVDEIPVEERGPAVRVRVIAGTTGRGTSGPVRQPLTDLRYFDATLSPGSAFIDPVPSDHNAFIYMVDGNLEFPGDDLSVHPLTQGTVAMLSHGDEVRVSAGPEGARFLLVSGRPLRESVVRGEGFVMNTMAEVQRARDDFRLGRLTS